MADLIERARIIIDAEGNAPERIRQLTRFTDELRVKIKEVGKATPEGQQFKKQLDEIRAGMLLIRNEAKNKIQLIIDGKEAGKSVKDVGAAVRVLEKEVRSLDQTTQEFTSKNARLQQLRGEFNRLNDTVKGTGGWFSKLKDNAQAFGVVALGYLGLQQLTATLQNIISKNAKLSDSLSDLQRVAGLTKSEVSGLYAELKNSGSRTGTQELLNIAIISGKLGVAKNDIASFTKEVDKLVVTLGDELGDAEQITTSLGKILNVFEGKITADGISKLGNAFVVLANSGVATGGFIADFTQRLSGIADAANLSLPATVGLGAGLEELGQKTESSSTAISKLLVTIGQDIPKAAKIAGAQTVKEIEEFTRLFAEKPEQALLKFAEGLTRNKATFAEIASSFKDAGEEGARVISTLAQLGGKAEFIRGKIDQASEAMKSNSAITEAFALKNENFAATWDKLIKRIFGFVTSSGITGALTTFVSGIYNLIKPIEDAMTASERLFNEWKNGTDALKNLQNNIEPLLKRYDELKLKSELSKDEQAELQKIIKTVSDTLPGAISGFDDYGNAIDISTFSAREFIKAQQDLTAFKNKEAIEQAENSIKSYQSSVDGLVRTLRAGGFEQTNLNTGVSKFQKLSPEEVKQFQAQVQEMAENVRLLKLQIKELRGEPLVAETKIDPVKPEDIIPKTLSKETQEKLEKLYAELNAAKADALKDDEQRELASLQAKFENRKRELLKDAETEPALKEATNKVLLALEEKLQTDRSEVVEKYSKKRDKDEFQQSIENLTDYNIKVQFADVERFAKGEITQREYDDLRKLHEQQFLDAIFQIYLDYNKTETKEGLRAAREQAENKIKTSKDALEQIQNDSIAAHRLALLETVRGTQEEFEAQRALKEEQYQIDLARFKGTEDEKKVFIAQHNREMEDMELEHTQRKIDIYSQYLSAIISIGQAAQRNAFNREEKELAQDRKLNDEKKKNLKAQLDAKLISQEEYNKQIEALDSDYDKKAAALKARQWKAQQQADIISSTIATALAVAKALPNIPLSVLAGVLGGIQTTIIATQDPPEFAKGYGRGLANINGTVLEGPKHDSQYRGMPVIDPTTGEVKALFEGGELLLSSKFVDKNPLLAAMLLRASQQHEGDLSKIKSFGKGAAIPPIDPLNTIGVGTFSSVAAADSYFDADKISTTFRQQAAPTTSNDTGVVNLINTLTSQLIDMSTRQEDLQGEMKNALNKLNGNLENPKAQKNFVLHQDIVDAAQLDETIRGEAAIGN